MQDFRTTPGCILGDFGTQPIFGDFGEDTKYCQGSIPNLIPAVRLFEVKVSLLSGYKSPSNENELPKLRSSILGSTDPTRFADP